MHVAFLYILLMLACASAIFYLGIFLCLRASVYGTFEPIVSVKVHEAGCQPKNYYG